MTMHSFEASCFLLIAYLFLDFQVCLKFTMTDILLMHCITKTYPFWKKKRLASLSICCIFQIIAYPTNSLDNNNTRKCFVIFKFFGSYWWLYMIGQWMMIYMIFIMMMMMMLMMTFFYIKIVRTLTHSPVALLQYRHSKKKHGKWVGYMLEYIVLIHFLCTVSRHCLPSIFHPQEF